MAYTQHWAAVRWNGVRDDAGNIYTQVVSSKKSREAAERAARGWRQRNLSPKADAWIVYIGHSDPRERY